MKKVLFDISTPYQLLIAIITCEIYYDERYYKTALLNNAVLTNIDELKYKLILTKYFNNIYIINELGEKDHILNQINELDLFNYDIYHFSSYASVFSCYLYNNMSNHTNIILNEEGIATYDLFNSYKEYKELFPDNPSDDIDLNKLSKILLIRKELYNSENRHIVESFSLKQIKNKLLLLEKLNLIFDYSFKEIKENFIFFTQNFLDYNVVTYEETKIFLKKLKGLYRNDLIFKIHPFDKNVILYKELNIKILSCNTQTPWELIVFNHLMHNKFNNKTLMTIGSTSLCNTHLFFSDCKKNNTNYKILTNLFYTPFNQRINNFYTRLSSETDFKYSIL